MAVYATPDESSNPFVSPAETCVVPDAGHRQKRRISRGRALVLSVAAVILGLWMAIMLLSALVGAIDKLPRQLLCTALAGGLLWHLYQGRNWARTLTLFFLAMDMLSGAIRVFEIIFEVDQNHGPASLAIALPYMFCEAVSALILLFSRNVGVFMHSQRQRRRGE